MFCEHRSPRRRRVALGLLAMAAAIQCGPADSGNAQQANSGATLPAVFDYAGAEALIAALERDSLTTGRRPARP
jgi:hypothetical protein